MQNDKLFCFLQVMGIQISRKRTLQKERKFIQKGLSSTSNVFNIQNITLNDLEKNNEQANKFIMRDILHTLQMEDKLSLQQNLFSIVSKRDRQTLLNLV